MTMPSPLIAIIRGVRPEEAVDIGQALVEGGFESIEVPLNSPNPFDSIEKLRNHLPDTIHIGAGTVLTPEEVIKAQGCGSSMIVSPNMNTAVIEKTLALGMHAYPGVATATEAFTAIAAGAKALKLFPSNGLGIGTMQAWQSVMPKDIQFLAVGGVELDNFGTWLDAGAAGAGIGSSLYRAGDLASAVEQRARAFRAVFDAHAKG